MLRILTILAFMATLGMAGVVYKLKYETRALQLQAAELRRDIRDERNQLAVTKAEWSIVTTPALVEETARKIGLRPLKANQIITLRELDALPLLEGAQQDLFVSFRALPGRSSLASRDNYQRVEFTRAETETFLWTIRSALHFKAQNSNDSKGNENHCENQCQFYKAGSPF